MPSIAWFEHSMRWVLITALGFPVEPEVNRNLAIVSGATVAMRGGDAGCVFGAEQIGEQRGLAIAERIARDDELDARPAPFRRCARANGPPSLAKTSPGVSRSMIARSLPKSLDISE